MDVIPNFWTFKNPVTATKPVLVFKPYSGPTQVRTFGPDVPQHNWELGNDDISHEDFLVVKAFWDDHWPAGQFYLYDPELNETRTYEVDSDLNQTYNSSDSYAISFRIREAYPFASFEGPPEP